MQLKKAALIILAISFITAGHTAEGADNEGFIYGKITTRDGDTYTGTMRWGKQELFWDDLFNASKEDNPWLRYAPKNKKKKSARGDGDFSIFGLKVYQSFGFADTHIFMTQFGEIETIMNRRHSRSTIIMKNGAEFDVDGGGDIDVKIRMVDEDMGRINIKWDNIKKIEFMPTPRSAETEGYRLRGKLRTSEMDFEGYILWDAEESISTDILDGETEDGDMEIECGNIRSIKRLSRRACLATLKDGREYELRGTNDVNNANRGIFVMDERYGKIEVQWDEFREVIYEDKDDSGKPYKAYKSDKKLEGIVETIDGGSFEGDIVFDLDETEGYEILNGHLDDMEFYIPFHRIKSITPKGRHSSIVEFRNGEELRLEDSQDVSDSNDGLIVFMGKRDNEYIDWEDIEKITFK